MDTISPELALVDEQLKARGRQLLHDFPHRIASPTTPPEPERVRRTVPLAPVLCTLLAAVLLGTLSAGGSEASEAVPPTAQVVTAAPTTQPALQPRQLRWQSVPGAAFYNVILWRGGKRVLDLWPRTASVPLPLRRLTSGVYQWFVYPVRERRGKQQFGRLAASGTVRV